MLQLQQTIRLVISAGSWDVQFVIISASEGALAYLGDESPVVLAVAKSPRSVSITRKECTSLPLQLPPPPSRTIPPSRPGNDPSKAVLKVVPSLITIPLHFYILFSVMCLFFLVSFFLIRVL